MPLIPCARSGLISTSPWKTSSLNALHKSLNTYRGSQGPSLLKGLSFVTANEKKCPHNCDHSSEEPLKKSPLY